jgi:hypothetical protein
MCLMNFCTVFARNISYFKKKRRDIMLNARTWYYSKKQTCASDCEGKWVFSTHFWDMFKILNCLIFLRLDSDMLQTERQTWRIKCSNFVILRNRPKLWIGFLMSFHRPCVEILALILIRKRENHLKSLANNCPWLNQLLELTQSDMLHREFFNGITNKI